jgi:glycosyltransferase involved in cell wall biosynthesis
MPDGSPWPRITVVTPSLNQGQFLEETLRSVLLQSYPNLEYFVQDGGSRDGSVEIIRKYEKWLTRWVSEPDKGHADAVNKAMAQATGHILAFMNSDDLYLPGALAAAARALAHVTVGWCSGDTHEIDADSQVRMAYECTMPRTWMDLISHRWGWTPQPSCFWTRTLWEQYGPLDTTLFFSFDWDLFCRFLLRGYAPKHCGQAVSAFRMHPATKTARCDDIRRHDDGVIWQRCLSQCGPMMRCWGRIVRWWASSPRLTFLFGLDDWKCRLRFLYRKVFRA